ncbi:hypothetical protein ACTP2L_06815, partial [Campylobacter jejuni]
AAAEPTRAVRYLNVVFGAGLIAAPFVLGADLPGTVNSLVCGLGLIVLSRPRGTIQQRYGTWDRLIV